MLRSTVVLTITVMLLAVSCAAPAATATPAPTPTTTPIPISDVDAQALRDLTFSYWEAFNAYDADRTLSYLDVDYRLERESQVREDIGRIRTFRVKLGVTEKTPPVMTGPDKAEMYLEMKEPIGTRTIRMAFLRTDGVWSITYAQEVP